MAHIYTELFLLISILASQHGLGTSLTIEIETASTDGMLNNQVNISCLPDGKEVIIMEIVKGEGEGNPIATIRQTSNIISYGIGMGKNFQVEGHLSRDNVQDYLRLTITNPGITDLGRYQCVMFYIGATGDLDEDKSARNLTLEDLDILMLVNFLMTKVSNMEDTILDQKQTIKQLQDKDVKLETQTKDQEIWNKAHEDQESKLERQLQDQRDQLVNQSHQVSNVAKSVKHLESMTSNQSPVAADFKEEVSNTMADIKTECIQYTTNQSQFINERVSNVQKNVEYLESITSNQSLVVADLKNKDTVMSAFTAGYSRSHPISDGAVMVFNSKIVDIGGHYNNSNGLYTAPVDGIYVFHLVVGTYYAGQQLQVDIMANNQQVARVYAYDKSHLSQSSNNAVVRLAKGQVVKAVVVATTSGHYYAWYSAYSVFSGFLLKAL